MSDFLMRVAERALGTAPRIDPQSASRYAHSRLPLPASSLPEMTTAAGSDSAPIAPPLDSLDSYDEQPARRQLARPPIVTPVPEDAGATDVGHVPASKSDRRPAKPKAAAPSLQSQSRTIARRTQSPESQSGSVAPGTPPIESQSRSMAQRNRDAEQPVGAGISEQPSVDTLHVTGAFEASTFRDDDRFPESAPDPFPIKEPNRRTSEDHVSVSK